MKKKKPQAFTEKYRPTKWSQVVGQPNAVKILRKMVVRGVPQALALIGPTGSGKTTCARILKEKVGCVGKAGRAGDFEEINAASSRGIDMARKLERQIGVYAMFGKSRVWIIDEAHALTKDAQNALLKVLEDPTPDSYVILCTTDPDKLIKTVQGRCTKIKFSPVDHDDIFNHLEYIQKEEDLTLHPDVIDRISEVADGSVREAVKILDQVSKLEPEDQYDAIVKGTVKDQAWKLTQLLMGWGGGWNKAKWSEVKEILKNLEGEDPEGIRHLILKCLGIECLKGGKSAVRALHMFEVFRIPTYDTKFTGLIFACFACVGGN